MSVSRNVIFAFISDQDEALVAGSLPASLGRFEPYEDVKFYISLNDDYRSFTLFTDGDDQLQLTNDMIEQAKVDNDNDTIAFPVEDGDLVLSFWRTRLSEVPA